MVDRSGLNRVQLPLHSTIKFDYFRVQVGKAYAISHQGSQKHKLQDLKDHLNASLDNYQFREILLLSLGDKQNQLSA